MDKQKLFNYKCDYSVQTLRTELKALGRILRNNSLTSEEYERVERAMGDIRSTLSVLKWKYGINNKLK